MPVIENDPFGKIKPTTKEGAPKEEEVERLHTNSDRDSATTAQHHTLGRKHNQASTGDHNHNGVNSKRVGEGVTITGSRTSGTALQNLILALGFTDGTSA
jgi:hypothetical protein